MYILCTQWSKLKLLLSFSGHKTIKVSALDCIWLRLLTLPSYITVCHQSQLNSPIYNWYLYAVLYIQNCNLYLLFLLLYSVFPDAFLYLVSVFCNMWFVSWNMYSVFFILYFLIFILYSLFCTLHLEFCMLYSVSSNLYFQLFCTILFLVFCCSRCILYTVVFCLYTVFCILY